LADHAALAINEVDERSGLWQVIVYCSSAEEAALLRDRIIPGNVFAAPPVISGLPDEDWVRKTLQGLPPVIAGRFQLYGPHDRGRRNSSGVALEIGAGTAFGTGHHGTTTGCLLALDRLLKNRRPRRVLDLGCGTGVLAMAAAKALRRPVLATDIDPEAVRVCRANARRNGLQPLLTAQRATGVDAPLIRKAAPYDLIFANILARPLVQLAPGLSRLLARRGCLVLSGMTSDQVRLVQGVYLNHGLRLQRLLTRDSWATLMLVK
jgi:ribosomal protein L11 methyltransferase